MRRIGPFIAISLVSLLAWTARAEPRVFTDQFGREIKAEIESVRPPNVVLKRADGRTFLLPIKKLSDTDQALVEKWRIANPPINLDYRFEKTRKSTKGDSQRRTESWSFKVTVSNRAPQDLDELKVEYTVFKEVNDRYAKKRRRFSGMLKSRETISSLLAQGKVTFETAPITTGKVNTVSKKRSKEYTDTTYQKWDEDLVGIRLSVSYRDKVVDSREFGSLPEGDGPIPDVEMAKRISRTHHNDQQRRNP